MNETVRKWLVIGGIVMTAIFTPVSGWNGYAVSRSVSVNGAPPTSGQVAAVALPGLIGTSGGMISLIAWLAGIWKPKPDSVEAKTLDVLKAIAVLVDAGVGQQAKGLIEALKENGIPHSARMEFTWQGKGPVGLAWGTSPLGYVMHLDADPATVKGQS